MHGKVPSDHAHSMQLADGWLVTSQQLSSYHNSVEHIGSYTAHSNTKLLPSAYMQWPTIPNGLSPVTNSQWPINVRTQLKAPIEVHCTARLQFATTYHRFSKPSACRKKPYLAASPSAPAKWS
jgi:hypothetical protein